MEIRYYCKFVGAPLIRILPPVLLIEFILGVLGNGLALWIFCFHLKPWKSSTVLLFNLALADFLLNVGLPFRASYYLSGMDWRFGDTFCNVSLFTLAMNRGGSVFFLMTVALDRFMRVVHPYHPVNHISLSTAVCVATGLWVLTFLLNVHLLTNSHIFQAGNLTYCESFSNKNKLQSAVFLLEFLVSLGTILYCCRGISGQLRLRRLVRDVRIHRVQRCLALVTVMFIVCFLPSNFTRLLIWVQKGGADGPVHNRRDCEVRNALDTAFYITISLTYLNSMLDPVVYYFFSPSFKRIYRRALRLSLSKTRADRSGATVNRSSVAQCLVQVRHCLHLTSERLSIHTDTSRSTQIRCPTVEKNAI